MREFRKNYRMRSRSTIMYAESQNRCVSCRRLLQSRTRLSFSGVCITALHKLRRFQMSHIATVMSLKDLVALCVLLDALTSWAS